MIPVGNVIKMAINKRYARLGDLLRRAREDRGITQIKLAKMVKHNQPYLSKIEHGERPLDVIEFIGICEKLRVDPAGIVRQLIDQ